MSSNWLINFGFLHTKGSDDVQLWRLKKTGSSSSSASSPIMRLTPDDFEYISELKDHQKLIENMFQWNITYYNNLINYISTRRLLVNGEGMVIAELLQYDEDENELLVYFRSPDVLSLKTYIPSVQNRRKVKDVVVVPPMVDSNATLQDKLDKERSDKQILAKRVADLEAENKILETDVTKLKADLSTRRNEIVALETENKTLKVDMTKLKADMATRANEIAGLEADKKTLETNMTKLEADLATKTNEIAILEAENKTRESDDVIKLKADLATKTNENADLESKYKILAARTNEVWMKDFTGEIWDGIEKLNMVSEEVSFRVFQNKGYFTKEDNSVTTKNITNVSARYWFQVIIGTSPYTAIEIDELLPNKEKARFSRGTWSRFQSKGKTYAYR